MPASTMRVPARRPKAAAKAVLATVAVGTAAVFALAGRVDPYDASGRPLTMGTHRQLGLAECSFLRATGKPCPSCGMTTSFALLVRGDVGASLRANAVGTLTAVCWAGMAVWSAACLARGRLLGVRSLEPPLLVAAGVFAGLALLRWGVLMALG